MICGRLNEVSVVAMCFKIDVLGNIAAASTGTNSPCTNLKIVQCSQPYGSQFPLKCRRILAIAPDFVLLGVFEKEATRVIETEAVLDHPRRAFKLCADSYIT